MRRVIDQIKAGKHTVLVLDGPPDNSDYTKCKIRGKEYRLIPMHALKHHVAIDRESGQWCDTFYAQSGRNNRQKRSLKSHLQLNIENVVLENCMTERSCETWSWEIAHDMSADVYYKGECGLNDR